jgi:diaminopimelate epimerase
MMGRVLSTGPTRGGETHLKFVKGHGTGNDFVILPDPDGALDLTPSLVAALCDRHRGIGADGVLRVVRSAKHPDAAGYAGSATRTASPYGHEHPDEAEWFMDYRNADGSIAEMCGNGVRVFTRYLITHGLAEPAADGLPIATRAGVVRAVVGSPTIAVRMTNPRVYDVSTATAGPLTVPGVAVDCGNPHLVCAMTGPLDTLDLHVAPGYDPALFPAGVNVSFYEGNDRHVRMRVYERGSGETLSCGSGALAVGAAVLRDAGRGAGEVIVDLPGGRLTVTATEDGQWWLAGPAVLVAGGEVDVAALS